MNTISKKIYASIVLSILAAGCTSSGTESPELAEQKSSTPTLPTVEETSEPRETTNVTYRGIVQEAGISIYMQGSHRLLLPAGRFILLESDTINLGDYVGKEVEVFGSVRPTVEAGGMIMRVTKLTEMTKEEPQVHTGSTALLEPTEGQGEQKETIPNEETPAEEEVMEKEPVEEEELPKEEVVTIEQERSAELQARIVTMSNEDLAPHRWTQQYCSTHVNFCFNIHKNRWYQSFGVTNSSLWHVEVSDQPISTLGDGIIFATLKSGNVPFADGTLQTTGNTIVGVRSLGDERYLQIEGPKELEQEVRMTLESITSLSES